MKQIGMTLVLSDGFDEWWCTVPQVPGEKEKKKRKEKKRRKKKRRKKIVQLFNSNFQECSLGYKKCKSFCRLHDNSSNTALIVCVFFLLRSLCSTYDPINKNNFQQNALSNRHIKMFDVILLLVDGFTQHRSYDGFAQHTARGNGSTPG